jgi:hypothetical protein
MAVVFCTRFLKNWLHPPKFLALLAPPIADEIAKVHDLCIVKVFASRQDDYFWLSTAVFAAWRSKRTLATVTVAAARH